MSSKLEINIRSLIAHCEEMANANNKDWRLKKYIKSLDTMIKELEEDEFDEKKLKEYYNRCNGLKKIADYIESNDDIDRKSIKAKFKSKTSVDGEQIIKEINQIHNSKYHNDLRKELIGKNELEAGLRKRNPQGGDDMGQAVKYYTDLQEQIAESMLSLTRNLKEQTETANKIIKKDTEIVTKSTHLSDKNVTSLGKEAEKLQDHSKKAWKCWMWLMIGLVMMIFIGMVLFMKLVKKKVK